MRHKLLDNLNTSFDGNATFNPPAEVVAAQQAHRLVDLPNRIHGDAAFLFANVVSGWLFICLLCRAYFVSLLLQIERVTTGAW